jgi:hypothetical protein
LRRLEQRHLRAIEVVDERRPLRASACRPKVSKPKAWWNFSMAQPMKPPWYDTAVAMAYTLHRLDNL